MKQNNNNNAESGFLGSISSSSIRNFLPKSFSSNRNNNKPNSSNLKPFTSNAENTPPSDPNIPTPIANHHHHKQSQIITPIPLHAEPNATHDPPVKVVVRIRPENGDGKIAKVSSGTLCVGNRMFTFDEVFDTNCSQEDVFQSVGLPLVRDALAGYNTSILSYGQSGSGKTYTMWGPPSSIVEEPLCQSQQGIAPRIFRMLFTELEKEKRMSNRKQFNYQCRCSFLEIYDERIGNLLNPIQWNLEVKEDSKNALYIENLIEEYISSYDDVAQILIKGLSRRKVGNTSLNSNSSRSHIIFTFVVESWCKGTSKRFAGSKTSRISLIDLAGLDGDTVDGADQCQVESRNVKMSLSQLGNLVDALTEEPQSENEDSPHSNSCLTRLLQESLGGNAKLSVICSVSPDNKNNSETLHTLRFGQQVRSIRNEPVVNEIKEDDIDYSGTIKLLKEELIREKDDVHSSIGGRNGFSQGRNVKESLNHLRVSLNRSLILPHLEHDSDEEVNVNEDDFRQLRQQIDELYSSSEGIPKGTYVTEDCVKLCSIEENCDAGMASGDETEKVELCYGKKLSKPCHEDIMDSAEKLDCTENTSVGIKSNLRDRISVSSCNPSPILDGPQLSESPKFSNSQRKNGAISTSYPGSWNDVEESSNFSEDLLGKSLETREHVQSSLQSSKAESLAASLHRGLKIIDYHQKSLALNKSTTSFSFDHLTLMPCPEIEKAESSELQLKPSSNEVYASFLCASCRTKLCDKDSTGNPGRLTDEVPKHLEKVTMREKDLENLCKEQAAKIEQLNEMVEKMKGQGELNSIIMYGKHEEHNSMNDKDKILRGASSLGHLPYIIEEKYEIKEIQEEFAEKDSSFDASEKESLLKEIQKLRSKLQLHSDAPVKKSTDMLRSSLMSRSIQLQKIGVLSHDNGGEELETERRRWTEMESEWICLTDELRVDLESYRQRLERLEMELTSEKKCTAELDDALNRAVTGHARIVEHYAELQEKYNHLVIKHEAVMEGIAEVKKAAAKASKKGHARFAKSLAAELSAMRVEREKESKLLKKENQILRSQLRDTAEAVQAAGELLVRLREAEHSASVAEENFANMRQDNEKLRMQIEKLQNKHKTEISTMKKYLAESKLPESALQPLYREEDSEVAHKNATSYEYDDQAWRAEFGASYYQDHY